MSGNIPDYLKKNFDPNSLTIPQLRSILKDHGVENVPAPNQPKRVFIKLFNIEIADNRDEIIKKLDVPPDPPKKRKGRPKKNASTTETLKPDLPQALRGKSESPAPSTKEVKNKRVSFGVNEIKVNYEPEPPAKIKKTIKTEEAKKPVKESKKEKKPLIQSTINKLNEEHEHNNLYKKSYNSEQTGISAGNVKRARQKFNEDSKQQNVEIKKTNRMQENSEEPSPKKRKQSAKVPLKSSNSNTSFNNIFQKFDNPNKAASNPPSSTTNTSTKIPKANVVFAEDDEEDDEDYVYQSNSPSVSTSSGDDVINDEEMADLEKDSASSSNINFSEGSYQEQYIPVAEDSAKQTLNEGSPLNKMSTLERPNISQPMNLNKGSTSFSYGKGNDSFVKSKLEKPHSYSFSYNKPSTSFSKSNKQKSSSFAYYKKPPSPYNTSFNDKPKINISYDMSPIQSSHNSMLYDDTLLNQNSEDRTQNEDIIGNLYESIDDDDNEPVVTGNRKCSCVKNTLIGLLSFIITTLIGLFIQWYLQTGGFTHYCEPKIDLKTITRDEFVKLTYLNKLPENSIMRYNPFYHILPKCLNCPKNAICKGSNVIGCEKKDDILHTRLIGHLIPEKYLVFPLKEKVCGFDYETKRKEDRKLQNTRSLMNISVDIIRKQLGEQECNENSDEKNGISENRLRDLLYKEIGSQIRGERFDELWYEMVNRFRKYPGDEAIKKLNCTPEMMKKKWKTTEKKDDSYFCDVFNKLKYHPNEGDKIETKNSNSEIFVKHEGLFVTTEKPIYTMKCRMKRFMDHYIVHNIQNVIKRFWKYGLGMVILTILAALVDFFVKRRTKRANVVNSICEEVIWLLQEAEYQNKEDPLHFPSPNISVAQLYDVLLPAVISPKDKNVPEGDCVEIVNNDGSTTHYWVFHKPKERALIWKRVYEQVRANSNVLESNALVKRESHRCWEWIGNPALYIRRKSPNTINKQTTTYYPKNANNSRLSLGGASNKSFNSQQFAGDISAISNAEGNVNESYMTFNENEEDKDADTSLKGHINKLSIFNSRRQSKIGEDNNNEGLTESSFSSRKSSISRGAFSSTTLYPTI